MESPEWFDQFTMFMKIFTFIVLFTKIPYLLHKGTLMLLLFVLSLIIPNLPQNQNLVSLQSCYSGEWNYMTVEYAHNSIPVEIYGSRLEALYDLQGYEVDFLGYAGSYYSNRNYEAEKRGLSAGYKWINLNALEPYATIQTYSHLGSVLNRIVISYYVPFDMYFVVLVNTQKSNDGFYHGIGCQYLVEDVGFLNRIDI